MSSETVYKMTGSGNDFVFVDGRASPLDAWTPERIRRICQRRLSVGADGLAVLLPGSAANAVRFHFFNSDGGGAAMCGNAALCATRLAARLELADGAGMQLETDAGLLRTRCLAEPHRAAISLGPVPGVEQPEIELVDGESAIGFVVVGVPHLVVLVADVDTVDIPNRGRELRSAPQVGSAGANANFVSRTPDGRWRMRTYERGVEAETLACGTGAVASGAFLAARGLTGLPWDVETGSGSRLTVAGVVSGTPSILADAELAGEGRLVAEVILTAE